jgi:hypothetical protein
LSSTNPYLFDLRSFKRWAEELAIHLGAGWDLDLLQLCERDVSPLGEYRIADDGITEEEILTVIFRNEPVAVSYEEVNVDRLILQWDLLGFIELRELCELFWCWFLYQAEAEIGQPQTLSGLDHLRGVVDSGGKGSVS